jgi:hypothetical protein
LRRSPKASSPPPTNDKDTGSGTAEVVAAAKIKLAARLNTVVIFVVLSFLRKAAQNDISLAQDDGRAAEI